MKIRAAYFTENGKELLYSMKEALSLSGKERLYLSIREEGLDLYEWTEQAFLKKEALLFVGASGIAVRAISPFVKSKLSDVPVLVMDEKGGFVIPILSGHLGGANELALKISELTGAVPVITTATDLNDAFAVDLFAKDNHLSIENKEGIAKVSAKALRERKITLSIKDFPPQEPVDILIGREFDEQEEGYASLRLREKTYVCGIGCKKGKSADEIEAAVFKMLKLYQEEDDFSGKSKPIQPSDFLAVATIDLKEEEEGLVEFCDRYHLPLLSFDAELLNKAGDGFTGSAFVENTVGVDNVCERAAYLASGCGELLIRKTACEGVTCALARKRGNWIWEKFM